MQDKENYIFEERFVTESWNKMSDMLDGAIPHTPSAKVNHRWLIGILSILLCISILISIYYVHRYKSFIPVSAVTKEKVIYRDVYIPQTVQNSVNPSAVLDSEKVTLKQQRTGEEISQGSEANPSYETPALLQRVLSTHEALEEDNGQLALLELPESGVSSSIARHLASPISNSENQNEETSRSIRYNVGLVSSASSDLAFTGLGVVSGVELPIGDRFGLTTGFAFNVLSRDQYFTPYFDRAAEDYHPLRRVKQVYLPLNLNYMLTKSLAINSGVRLRYTYEDRLIISQGRRSPGAVYEDNFWHDANLGVSAGVSYRIGNHVLILVDSEWGLGAIKQNPFASAATSYDFNLLNLTTSYTF